MAQPHPPLDRAGAANVSITVCDRNEQRTARICYSFRVISKYHLTSVGKHCWTYVLLLLDFERLGLPSSASGEVPERSEGPDAVVGCACSASGALALREDAGQPGVRHSLTSFAEVTRQLAAAAVR